MFSDLSSSQLHTLLLLPRQQRGEHQPEASSSFPHAITTSRRVLSFHWRRASWSASKSKNPRNITGGCLLAGEWANDRLVIRLYVSENAEFPLKKSEQLLIADLRRLLVLTWRHCQEFIVKFTVQWKLAESSAIRRLWSMHVEQMYITSVLWHHWGRTLTSGDFIRQLTKLNYPPNRWTDWLLTFYEHPCPSQMFSIGFSRWKCEMNTTDLLQCDRSAFVLCLDGSGWF